MTLPMSRAIKAGVTLRFGLAQIPVSLHSTAKVEDDEGELKTVCHGHGAPETFVFEGSGKTHTLSTIKQVRSCPVCTATQEFGKAHPVGEGLVEIPEDVLAAAQAADDAFAKEIALEVHPAAEWAQHAMPTGKSYYVSVKGSGAGYVLMVALLRKRPDLAFIAMHSVRGAAHLYQLVVADDADVLMLVQMADPELVRAAPKVTGEVKPIELAAAERLADDLLAPLDPTVYTRPKQRVIAEYLEGRVPVAALSPQEVAAGGGQVLSLMAALEASVESKGGKVPAQKTPAKAPAKKTAAKKTAATRTRRTAASA